MKKFVALVVSFILAFSLLPHSVALAENDTGNTTVELERELPEDSQNESESDYTVEPEFDSEVEPEPDSTIEPEIALDSDSDEQDAGDVGEDTPLDPNSDKEQEAYQLTDAEAIILSASDFTYTVNNNDTITIDGYIGSGGNVTIPNTIDGLPVAVINNTAFQNCTTITSITIPNSVTHMKWKVFQGCTGLTSITIPKSVTNSYGYGAYYGQWFEDCTSLTEVVFEDGTTTIPRSALRNAPALTTIVMPNTVKTIEDYAFQNCTALQSTSFLPNGLETIGNEAFRDCTSLASIAIPNSVTHMKWKIFQGCTGLTNVTIPKSVTNSYGYGAYYGQWFEDCVNLTEVLFEEGATVIPNGALRNIPRVSSILIPNTVTTIGSNAFRGCPQLSQVYMPDTNINIGSNAFSDSPKLVLYCNEASFALIYAIDNGIPFHIMNERPNNPELYNLDITNTSYNTNISDLGGTGYITLIAKYSFREAIESSINNVSVEFRVPSQTQLVERTLMVDGKLSTNHTTENNYISVPLEKTSGEIRFCVKPNEYSKFTSYMIMNFKKDGIATSEMAGVVNAQLPMLTLLADDYTDSSSINVGGVTLPGNNVDLYVNEQYIKSVNALKTGTYKAEIALPNPKNYLRYTIKAVSRDDSNNEIIAERSITYNEKEPILTDLIMTHGSRTVSMTELAGTKPIITFIPGQTFQFKAFFKNHENIDKVYVVSERNNIQKRMAANWDETLQCFVAEGLFIMLPIVKTTCPQK